MSEATDVRWTKPLFPTWWLSFWTHCFCSSFVFAKTINSLTSWLLELTKNSIHRSNEFARTALIPQNPIKSSTTKNIKDTKLKNAKKYSAQNRMMLRVQRTNLYKIRWIPLLLCSDRGELLDDNLISQKEFKLQSKHRDSITAYNAPTTASAYDC